MSNAPCHKEPIHKCDPCRRSFSNAEALSRHLQTSSRHTNATPLKKLQLLLLPFCRYFLSWFSITPADFLERVFGPKPRNHPPHSCPHCARSFQDATALANHINAKHRSRAAPNETPLDVFFRTYEVANGFRYDRAKAPPRSFAQLREHMHWKKKDPNHIYARGRYNAALQAELEVWFGSEDELCNWHALCRAVGITPLPPDGSGCRRALREKHVNLVDLIHWARSGAGEEERLTIFLDQKKLGKYCRRTKKWFPLMDVKTAGSQGDGKVVIRHLLRRLPRFIDI